MFWMGIMSRILRWLGTRQDRRLDRLEAAEPEKQRRHAKRMESFRGKTEVVRAGGVVKARLAEELE